LEPGQQPSRDCSEGEGERVSDRTAGPEESPQKGSVACRGQPGQRHRVPGRERRETGTVSAPCRSRGGGGCPELDGAAAPRRSRAAGAVICAGSSGAATQLPGGRVFLPAQAAQKARVASCWDLDS